MRHNPLAGLDLVPPLFPFVRSQPPRARLFLAQAQPTRQLQSIAGDQRRGAMTVACSIPAKRQQLRIAEPNADRPQPANGSGRRYGMSKVGRGRRYYVRPNG